MTEYLASEVNRRGWLPREWESGAQAENAISCGIWDLLDPVSDPVLVQVIVEALLDGAGTEERERLARAALWGFLPQASPGPDLALVDRNDAVRIVVENKSYAKPNARPYKRFNRHRRFSDLLAMSLPERPDDDEYVPGGPWGNPGGTGPLLWQIDYYRCSTGWLRPQITLDDADGVLWILLDRKNRSARDLFPSAHTAHIWKTTSYDGFARRLFTGYDEAVAAGAASRAEGLKNLICMVAG
jgi:hypothetical protein